MNSELDEGLGEALRIAIISNNAKGCIRISQKIGKKAFDLGFFPDSLVYAILDALQSADFLHVAFGAETLYHIFYYNTHLLSDRQKEEIFILLRAIVVASEELNCSFVGLELICGLWADKRPLEFFEQLAKHSCEHRRLLSTHGFDWLAGSVDGRAWRRVCLDNLRMLAHDSSDAVKAEALESLQRLSTNE